MEPLSPRDHSGADATADEEKPPPEIKWFTCRGCDMKQQYQIKGKSVPYSKHISLKEECYILKDPFSEPDKRNILILGSDCSQCKDQVCQSSDCSLFYKKRYCQRCASQNKDVFPEQLHSKIKTP